MKERSWTCPEHKTERMWGTGTNDEGSAETKEPTD